VNKHCLEVHALLEESLFHSLDIVINHIMKYMYKHNTVWISSKWLKLIFFLFLNTCTKRIIAFFIIDRGIAKQSTKLDKNTVNNST